jgi:hypothetical protein
MIHANDIGEFFAAMVVVTMVLVTLWLFLDED